METGKKLPLLPLFAAIFMILLTMMHSQHVPLPPPRPLCASQYVLVNNACNRLPYKPSSPPSLPSSSSPGQPGEHSHHRRRHGHRKRRETEEEAECCKWLTQMDPECVCDLLVHLPPFLSRILHTYTVAIDASCAVTYSCGGRIIR